MTGEDRKPLVAVSTSGADTMGQFSPDTRFVVFQTNESGRWEVVLQQFPQPGGTWTISSGGGAQPRWRADGKEVYFVSPDGKMMAAAIHTNGATVVVEKPTPLFATHVVNNTTLLAKQQYAVSRDGRFLIIEPPEGYVAPPITLILNWKP
jgi:Tol biopolymer transport system component